MPDPEIRIPFNRCVPLGRELACISEALASGQVGGDQRFARRCEKLLQESTGVPRALMTTSCTHALEMAGLLLDLQPGDEVIVPSYTFVSSINAFVLRGARPVFADIRADTLNLDERQLSDLITPRTRAIVPVHYAGIACEMDTIMAIARKHDIAVVEDNAHGLCGHYRNQPLGSFGVLATQSFHETKNFSCGEGGALLINDPALVERAEIIREKGTNRSQFMRGEIDKYSWVDLGSSYVLSDLLGAFLYPQLVEHTRVQGHRRQLWQRYHEELADWASAHGITQPTVPAHCEPAWHLYHLRLPDLQTRERLRLHLRSRGILAITHYVPLHSSPHGRQWCEDPASCPVTNHTADTLLRLPFYNSMSADEQSEVITAVREF
jgi:dTDP-4-amino-4,6-dideoxygalactose transaminase